MSDHKLKSFTWEEHFSELRVRGFLVLIVFTVTFALGFLGAKPLFMFIRTSDTLVNIDWNVFHPADVISIYVKFAFICGLIFTIPWCLYQIWRYLKPGLYSSEKKEVLIYIPFSFILFITGIFFSYFYIIPSILSFTSYLNKDLGFTETYGVTQYFSFIFNIIFPVSIMFELPVILMFLTRLGLLTPMLLKKARKHVYILLLVVSGIIAPPDLITQIMLWIPLIILYEFSNLLSVYIYRRYVYQKKKYIKSITEMVD